MEIHKNYFVRSHIFRAEVERNDLGSPPNREILDTIKPKRWFSAHLHVKFEATLVHAAAEAEEEEQQQQPLSNTNNLLVPSQVSSAAAESETVVQSNHDGSEKYPTITQTMTVEATKRSSTEIKDEDEDEDEDDNIHNTKFHGLESSSKCAGRPDLTELMTKFLALDKCLPRRKYLSIMHMPTLVASKEDGVHRLEYDPEWLAIVRKTHNMTCLEKRSVTVPLEIATVSDEEINWVVTQIHKQQEGLEIPKNFCQTVPSYFDPMFHQRNCPPFPLMGNPQTDALLSALKLEHLMTVPFDKPIPSTVVETEPQGMSCLDNNIVIADDNEIEIDDLSDAGDGDGHDSNEKGINSGNGEGRMNDDNEIDIDDLSDESDDDGGGSAAAAGGGGGSEIDISTNDLNETKNSTSSPLLKKPRHEEQDKDE